MVVIMSQVTCFHCGRKLSEIGSNPEDCGCSYCSILSNILKDAPVETKESSIDGSVLLLFVFIVLSIALAIFVYNWRDEAFYMLDDVKKRINLIFYTCLFPSFFHSMSEFSVGVVVLPKK